MTHPRVQIAFLTGRSDPDNWHLSPAQLRFLEGVCATGRTPVLLNFPWRPCPGEWQPVPLWRASVHNGREWILAQRARFASQYQADFHKLLAGAKHTVILAGSCGLTLFNQLSAGASIHNVSLFGYGPVAWRRPRCPHLLVQGHDDWISRFSFGRADTVIEANHLNYLEHHSVMELCERFVAARERSLW